MSIPEGLLFIAISMVWDIAHKLRVRLRWLSNPPEHDTAHCRSAQNPASQESRLTVTPLNVPGFLVDVTID